MIEENKSLEEEIAEIKRFGKEVSSTKESAHKFLRDCNIIDEEGNLKDLINGGILK
jgi:hypothetical protein